MQKVISIILKLTFELIKLEMVWKQRIFNYRKLKKKKKVSRRFKDINKLK